MCFMDQYKTEDGNYVVDGCEYKDIKSALIKGVFGFCGCGFSWYVLYYIHDELELIKQHEEWLNKDCHIKGDVPNPLRNNENDENKGRSCFLWYWFDKMGYTDHGGSVPGWLTDEGHALLECLNELLYSDNDF